LRQRSRGARGEAAATVTVLRYDRELYTIDRLCEDIVANRALCARLPAATCATIPRS
jgi:hypothetical protein